MLSHEKGFVNVFGGEWKAYNAGCPGRGRPEPGPPRESPLLSAASPFPCPALLWRSGQLAAGARADVQVSALLQEV